MGDSKTGVFGPADCKSACIRRVTLDPYEVSSYTRPSPSLLGPRLRGSGGLETSLTKLEEKSPASIGIKPKVGRHTRGSGCKLKCKISDRPTDVEEFSLSSLDRQRLVTWTLSLLV